jgi:phage/plasmid-associated DNA primase
MQTKKLNFLNGWTIDTNALPEYKAFTARFDLELSYPILKLCYESDDPVFTPEIKSDLKNVLDKVDKQTGILKVYHEPRYGLGRFYPNNSISPICLSRHVKHTLFHALNWVDIDMVKGHPSLIYSVAKLNGVEDNFKAFKQYLDNPDEQLSILADFYGVSNDIAKEAFNVCIYGGGFKTWVDEREKDKIQLKTTKEHEIIINFTRDCRKLITLVYENNPKIVERVTNGLVDEEKKKRRTMSYWCGTIENHIISIVCKFLKNKKILEDKKYALEYDGICFKPLKRDNLDQILVELNNKIQTETSLMLVKMKWKGYDQKHIHKDIIEAADLYEVEPDDLVTSDLEAAEKVIKLYPHWVLCNKKLRVFDESCGMWKIVDDDPTPAYRIFTRFVNELYTPNSKGEKSTKSYGNTDMLMRKLVPFIKTLVPSNNEWEAEMETTSLGKLLFNNGYYDLHTNIFHTEFTPKIWFLEKISRDYIKLDDDAAMNDIKHRYFINPLNKEMGEYMVLCISRALAGDRMKNIFFSVGMGNSGKSSITKAIQYSIGGYFGSFNAQNLAISNTSADAAQQLRWAKLLRGKRCIMSNELETRSQLNSNYIKRVSSGGDKIVAREHGQNEEEFIPHFNAFIFSQDLSKFSPYDDAIDNRLRVFSFNKVFVDEPSNEFELKKDSNIDNEVLDLKFQNLVLNLLINTYVNYRNDPSKYPEPSAIVEKCKNEWVETSEKNVIETFLMDFTFTGNENDYITNPRIEKWTNDCKNSFTTTKMSREINKYIGLNKIEGVSQMKKKIDGRSVNIWVGIKEKNDDEVDECAL